MTPRAVKPHDYRAVMVSKSSVLRGLFVSQRVQMFFADILPYLDCFDLLEINVTRSISPMNSFYHTRLISP